MRTTLLIAIALPALLATAPANAAKWVVIGAGAGDGRAQRSRRPAHQQDKRRQSAYLASRNLRAAEISDSGAFSHIERLTAHTEFHCDKRQAATISRSYTAADGSELLSESFDSREMLPIAPDSTSKSSSTTPASRPPNRLPKRPTPSRQRQPRSSMSRS